MGAASNRKIKEDLAELNPNLEFEAERERRKKIIAQHVKDGVACLHDAARICVEGYDQWDWQHTRRFYLMVVTVRHVKGIDSLLEAIDAFKSRLQAFATGERFERAWKKVAGAQECWTAAVGVKNKASELKPKRKKANGMV